LEIAKNIESFLSQHGIFELSSFLVEIEHYKKRIIEFSSSKTLPQIHQRVSRNVVNVGDIPCNQLREVREIHVDT